MADTKDNELDFPNWLKILGWIIVAVAAFVILTYFISFASLGVGNQEQFGQLGDYIGGLLNPILSFFTIFLLLWSIRLQSKELKLTRIEIENSNKELANSAKALEKTLEAHKDQYQLAINEATRTQIYDALKYHHNGYTTLVNKPLPDHSKITLNNLLFDDRVSNSGHASEIILSFPEILKNRPDSEYGLYLSEIRDHGLFVVHATCELYAVIHSRTVARSWQSISHDIIDMLRGTNLIDPDRHTDLEQALELPDKFNITPPK